MVRLTKTGSRFEREELFDVPYLPIVPRRRFAALTARIWLSAVAGYDFSPARLWLSIPQKTDCNSSALTAW